MRLDKGGVVNHAILVKYYDVCECSHIKATAILDPKEVSGAAGLLGNGFFQRQKSPVPNITPKHSRVGSIGSWVRKPFAKLNQVPVTRNRSFWMRYESIDVTVCHGPENANEAALAL